MSQAALAELTGLKKTTVSSLAGELIDRSFVREVGYKSGSIRRPGRFLDLNPGAGYIVTWETGVDFISVLCTDFAPEVIWRHSVSIHCEMGLQVIIDHALTFSQQAVDEGQTISVNLSGIAFGGPGLVDQTSGTLLFVTNLDWSDVSLQGIIDASLDAPVIVDNEANMAALGSTTSAPWSAMMRWYASALGRSGWGAGPRRADVSRHDWHQDRVRPFDDGSGRRTLQLWQSRLLGGRVSQSVLFRSVGEALNRWSEESILVGQTPQT